MLRCNLLGRTLYTDSAEDHAYSHNGGPTMSNHNSRVAPDKTPKFRRSARAAGLPLDPDPQSRCRPAQRTVPPDEAWDVFRLDEDESPDEPEPGDFWVEPDAPDDE